jgi:hypothetical protein
MKLSCNGNEWISNPWQHDWAAHKAVDPWPQEEYSEILPRSANTFFDQA